MHARTGNGVRGMQVRCAGGSWVFLARRLSLRHIQACVCRRVQQSGQDVTEVVACAGSNVNARHTLVRPIVHCCPASKPEQCSTGAPVGCLAGYTINNFDLLSVSVKHTRMRCCTPACCACVSAGYNINNFDLPYLFERAKALRVDGDAHQWGRIRHRCVADAGCSCTQPLQPAP
jgi:hypothetical protein